MDNNHEALANPQDDSRRIGTVIQRIQAFVRTKWEGRNTALHKNSGRWKQPKFATIILNPIYSKWGINIYAEDC
jgi:hypothetical protein